MASTRILLSSSSPTPAHQLHHPFRRFDPQPSPLSNSQLYRNRNNLRNQLRQELNSDDYIDDDDDEHAMNERHECLNDEDEDEVDSHGFQEDDDQQLGPGEVTVDREEVEDEGEYEAGDQSLAGDDQQLEYDVSDGNSQSISRNDFSPTLDASFATSMSIATAPPTPSLNPLASPSETRHSQRHGQSSFLPAHLFAPNPNAMPPSSSPHRMDLSPVPQASFSNPLNIASPDPFRCSQRQWQPWSTSPPASEARRTIGLKKNSTRSNIISPEPMSISSNSSNELSKHRTRKSSPTTAADGMEIDSPSYSQQRALAPSSDDLSNASVQAGSGGSSRLRRPGRSGSQCSIGKRSRSSDEELEEASDDGEEAALGSPRPGSSGSGASSLRLPSSSPKAPLPGIQEVPQPSFKPQWRRTASVAGPANLFPSSRGSRPSAYSFSPNSSPSQVVSPSVKAAASKVMTLGRKSGERSLTGFKLPVTKPGIGAGNTLNSTSSSRNYLQQYGANSLGAASGRSMVNGSKRPALGVVQSSATLFSRHQSAAPTSGITSNTLNRQRDAAGRPASKSRRAISFAATEGNLLLAVTGEEGEEEGIEEDDENSMGGPNCSPAPKASIAANKAFQLRHTSNTWPKHGGFSHHVCHPSVTGERDENLAEPTRKRSPPPPALDYLLQPPRSAHHNSSMQSPIRGLTAAISLGSTIESPVGMGFSEKERAGKILPCHKVSDDGLMRITPETMDGLMEGVYDEMITRRIIIDCRFGYEYQGGHIKSAINVREKERVEEMLLGGKVYGQDGKSLVPLPSESGKVNSQGSHKKVILVFHCEYSAMRAPTIAKHLREKDRHLNMPHYPALHYPEVYILEGGYAKYFQHSPQHCEGSYVKMDDPNHKVNRDQDLNMFRNKEIGQIWKRKC